MITAALYEIGRRTSGSAAGTGPGAGGMVARLEHDAWQAVPYPDPLPMFFGAGASLPGQSALVAGSPGGLVRVIGSQAN